MKSLKVNLGKSKVMILGRDEGLVREVILDKISLEYVLVFKSLRFVSFVIHSVLFSVLLPLLAHQLPGLEWKVSRSAPIIFLPLFFSSCLFSWHCCVPIPR